jgi:hypothetical protein
MIANAAPFPVGAVQHTGIALGRFLEPTIIPAVIVETVCALLLLCVGIAILGRFSSRWCIALMANLVALCGVLLGMIALAAGRGPRTASNDLYHHIMLVLIGVSLLLLFWIGSGNASFWKTLPAKNVSLFTWFFNASPTPLLSHPTNQPATFVLQEMQLDSGILLSTNECGIHAPQPTFHRLASRCGSHGQCVYARSRQTLEVVFID